MSEIRLALVVFLLVLISDSCNRFIPKNSFKSNIIVNDSVNINGHNYYILSSGDIIHDPDCRKCELKYEKEK